MTRTTSYSTRDPLDRFYTQASATYVLLEYLMGDLSGNVWEPFNGKGFISEALLRQYRDGFEPAINRIYCSDLDPKVRKHCGIYELDWESSRASFKQDDRLSGLDAFKLIENMGSAGELPEPFESLSWVATNTPYTFNLAKWLEQRGEIESEEDFEGKKKLSSGEWVKSFLENMPNTSLAVYMRVTWLEPSEERALLFKDFPPTDILFLPRQDFILPNGKIMKGNNCSSAWVIWNKNKPAVTVGGTSYSRNKWFNRSDVEKISNYYTR